MMARTEVNLRLPKASRCCWIWPPIWKVKQGGLGYVPLAQPRHCRLLPVNHDVELRIVLLPAYEREGDARHLLDAPDDLAGGIPGITQVITQLLDLDGLLRSRIDDAADDAAKLNGKDRPGGLPTEPWAHFGEDFLVFPAPFVWVAKIDLELCRMRSRVLGKES